MMCNVLDRCDFIRHWPIVKSNALSSKVGHFRVAIAVFSLLIHDEHQQRLQMDERARYKQRPRAWADRYQPETASCDRGSCLGCTSFARGFGHSYFVSRMARS